MWDILRLQWKNTISVFVKGNINSQDIQLMLDMSSAISGFRRSIYVQGFRNSALKALKIHLVSYSRNRILLPGCLAIIVALETNGTVQQFNFVAYYNQRDSILSHCTGIKVKSNITLIPLLAIITVFNEAGALGCWEISSKQLKLGIILCKL